MADHRAALDVDDIPGMSRRLPQITASTSVSINCSAFPATGNEPPVLSVVTTLYFETDARDGFLSPGLRIDDSNHTSTSACSLTQPGSR